MKNRHRRTTHGRAAARCAPERHGRPASVEYLFFFFVAPRVDVARHLLEHSEVRPDLSEPCSWGLGANWAGIVPVLEGSNRASGEVPSDTSRATRPIPGGHAVVRFFAGPLSRAGSENQPVHQRGTVSSDRSVTGFKRGLGHADPRPRLSTSADEGRLWWQGGWWDAVRAQRSHPPGGERRGRVPLARAWPVLGGTSSGIPEIAPCFGQHMLALCEESNRRFHRLARGVRGRIRSPTPPRRRLKRFFCKPRRGSPARAPPLTPTSASQCLRGHPDGRSGAAGETRARKRAQVPGRPGARRATWVEIVGRGRAGAGPGSDIQCQVVFKFDRLARRPQFRRPTQKGHGCCR